MTNSDFAETVRLTHSAVSRLRAGARKPSMDTLLKIAEAYDLSDPRKRSPRCQTLTFAPSSRAG
jgi:transcriptional regulator with XRE-family HTH domain